MPCILTRATPANLDDALHETTFLSVFTKLGFQTSWIGTQSILKYLKTNSSDTIYDEVNMNIIPGGSALYQMNADDAVMLPYIDKFLAQDGKKFIVIHTSGSHWNYNARYPNSFQIFNPICAGSSGKTDQPSCGNERLINSYDNSIRYTDYILSQIIERLKDKNSFMIYVSDHGESLGERGVYAHGGEMTPEQNTVPLIFWGSQSFMKHHTSLAKSLTKKRSGYSHDYVFHSVLDCSGIESDIVNKRLSICK